jgi:aldehyde oxidoreductase
MLTYLKARIVGDTGAYASVGAKVLTRIASHAAAAYDVPVVDSEAFAVYTNNLPCGAMRGFGVNQATFGMESCGRRSLCEQGGFDRWEFRYNNALARWLKDHNRTDADRWRRACKRAFEAIKDEFYKTKHAGLGLWLEEYTGIGNGMPDESSALISISKI